LISSPLELVEDQIVFLPVSHFCIIAVGAGCDRFMEAKSANRSRLSDVSSI
jgi:hypothetical protein